MYLNKTSTIKQNFKSRLTKLTKKSQKAFDFTKLFVILHIRSKIKITNHNIHTTSYTHNIIYNIEFNPVLTR